MSNESPLIAHVLFTFGTAGLENGVVNLANSIPVSRYRQAIICLTDYDDFYRRVKSSRTPIIALHKKSGKDLGVYVRLWKCLRQLRPDIVHTRNLSAVDAVIPAAMAGVRNRIHGEHGWNMLDLHGENRKYQRLRRLCDFFICRHIAVSRHLATWLHDSVGVSADKIVHIHNGVDTNKFSPSSYGRIDIGQNGFAPPGSLVIGTIGRMESVKGSMTLVQAFIELEKQARAEGKILRLVMIGDGPLKAELERVLAEANLLDCVWMPGKRDDVESILKGIDIFTMPSLNEGISNTVLEAMATGLPVVATDVGGNPELVTHGCTGYLVQPDDSHALAEAIRKYVENPALISEHGRAGRRVVEKEFSLKTMVSKYLAVYDSVAGVTGAASAQ